MLNKHYLSVYWIHIWETGPHQNSIYIKIQKPFRTRYQIVLKREKHIYEIDFVNDKRSSGLQLNVYKWRNVLEANNI